MRNGKSVEYARRALRIAGWPTLAAFALACSAALGARAPFSRGATGLAAAFTPAAYPLWITGGALGIYALLQLPLSHIRRPKVRAVGRTATTAALVLLVVLAIDVGCAAFLATQATERDFVPEYAYLASESMIFGRRSTVRTLSTEIERLCTVYNLPYAGRKAVGDGFAPTLQGSDYVEGGFFGRAQYAQNGLLAEGYVFSLDVALGILACYYRAEEELTAYLPAFNHGMGTNYTVEEALVALRATAKTIRLGGAAERANGTENGGTYGGYSCQTDTPEALETDVHALLAAIAADLFDSTLLRALGALSGAGGVPLDALFRALLGEETGESLCRSLRLGGVRLHVEGDLRIRLSGGVLREDVAFALGEAFDEAATINAFARGFDLSADRISDFLAHLVGSTQDALSLVAPAYAPDAPLSHLLATALGALFWYTPPTEKPLFDYYAAVSPRRDLTEYEERAFRSFLQAAAAHDRALYEGNLHGGAVGARLLGQALGKDEYPPSVGVTTAEEAECTRWANRYLTHVLPLLAARELFLLYGGVLAACVFLHDYWGIGTYRCRRKRKTRIRRYSRLSPLRPKRRAAVCPNAKVIAVLSLSLLFTTAGGVCLKYGVAPAVTQISYGIVDGWAIAADPAKCIRTIREEEERYLLFALLSGEINPDYAYENLRRKNADGYEDAQIQAASQAALANDRSTEEKTAERKRLDEWLWQYYIIADADYALAVTPAAVARRRAFAEAIGDRLYAPWRALCAQGLRFLRPSSPADRLFAEAYRTVTANGYAPLSANDALYLTLEERDTYSALAALVRGLPPPTQDAEAALGIADVYGRPVEIARISVEHVANAFADSAELLDEWSRLVAEDLALPHTKTALTRWANGRSLTLLFYCDEGYLHLAVYPSSYREGGVGYASGTLIRYQKALYVLCFLLPLGNFLLSAAPLIALFAATLAANRKRHHPKRKIRPVSSDTAAR